MSFPSSNSQDPSYSNSPTSTARNTRVQPSVWGSSNQNQGPRRGLTPISTALGATQNRSGASSPSRNTFSPTHSAFNTAQTARQISSRQSSASSSSSLFSPQSSSQQAPHTRSRNTTSTGSPLLASSAAGSTSAIQSSGAFSSGGGGASRFVRASPSLSQSAGGGSPISSSHSSGTHSGAPSGQLTSLVITQLNILLSTIREDKDRTKWENQAEKIRKLVDANGMEVFTQYFRRLLQSNASQIFHSNARSADGAGGTYQLLVNEMQKLTVDPDQAPKVAESLDTTDGDLFRDFDLSAFMDHFKVNTIGKTALALSCKTVSRQDLKTKADAILTHNFDNFLSTLSDPVDTLNDPSPEFLASLIDRLVHNPPRVWSEERKTGLQYAIRLRYNRIGASIPYAISAAMFLTELLSPQNSLVRLLQRTPHGTLSLDACKEMLSGAETSVISYQQVANALLYIVIAQDGEVHNPSVFVSGLRQHRSGQRLDWQDVVHAFDRPELRVTKPQLLALYNALLPLAKDYDNFDIQSLWGTAWNNPDTQLSFVVAFLSSTPDELDVTRIPRLRTAFTLDEFDDASEDVKEHAAQRVKHPMVSLDATQALFAIIFNSQEAYNSAQSLGIPEAVINTNTDVFVCAASAVQGNWVPLQDQALKQLFNPFFSKALPHYGFVMHALWTHSRHWLAARLIEHYNNNPKLLNLIFEHAQEHNWIEPFIQVKNDFGLDFTALAHSHGLVDLDHWAHEHVQSSGVPAPELSKAIINFLRQKMEDEMVVQREQLQPSVVPLKVKTVYALLNVMSGSTPDQEMGAIQRTCIQVYPRLINYGYKYDSIIDANGENGNALSEAADAKMQEEYKDMYGGDADARKMINTLRNLKDSDTPEDQDLFAAMIHGLFDEYNCFGEYPLEALATTAVLFGGIINYHLLESSITLGVAIFMVVDAVSEFSPEDSMYKFGLQALIHFSSRLEEWPTLCERLLRLPGLRGTEVYSKVEEIVRRQAGPHVNGGTEDPLTLTNGDIDGFSTEPLYQPFASIRTDTPLRADLYEEPDEETSDKVMFVLNNVSKRNLDEKFKDLESALEERHHQWFASYLVEDLVKSQPNFQTLYLQVLDLFDQKMLWAEVLRETFVSIAKILNSESTMTSNSDRTYLKNLAVWLGLLTLARNRPILHRSISFRDLLIEAHHTQRLLIAIPFTCKVLAQAAKSSIFRPPNPWTMELIGLLIELYHFADLKLNLKFEVEVLCKELDLDHKTLEPLDIIRSLPLANEEPFMPPYAPETMDGFGDMPLMGLAKRTASERFSSQDVLKSLPDLGALLHYPPSPGNVSQQQLKNIFLSAAQRAIQEIIAPVVERSVTIASISTAQLIAKDFAMESDPERLQASAYNVVKALSGSLALVTCKEPLRMSITNNIRLLGAQLLPDQLPEGSILMFVNDNLDTVCKLVEDSAENHSMSEIDAQIEEHMERRKRHKETRPGQPFNDPPVSRWAFFIPEPYRQEQNGLNQQQLAIYEEFGRQMRLPAASHTNNTSQDSNRQLPDVSSDSYLPNLLTPAEAPAIPRQVLQQGQRLQGPPSLQSQPPHAQVNGYLDMPMIGERVMDLLGELQHVAREAPEEHIRDLGPTAPTREVYEQLVHLIETSMHKDILAMTAGQSVSQTIYGNVTRLQVEVLVQFLNQLCAISVSTAKQLVIYLAAIEDDRIFNAPVTVCFVKTMLLDIQHVDVQIAKALHQHRPGSLEGLSDMIDELLLSDHQGALRADFCVSFDALSQWIVDEPGNETAREVMNKLQEPSRLSALQSPPESNKIDQYDYIFEEWIHLQRPDVPERSLASFVHQLHSRQIMTDREDFSLFIRICIDASVDGYEREENLPFGSLDHAYLNVDALAKLITCLVSYQGGNNLAVKSSKGQYFEAIMCLVVLMANHHHHTRQERFNSKVFFRLFSTLMSELNASKMHFGEEQAEITLILGRAILTLQPRIFPGFAFAWLSLISHRLFVVPVMRSTQRKGWEVYVKLLCALLEYLGEMMISMDQTPVSQDFYRGALRLICLLQHDHPEFLAENHLVLDSSVPNGMVQLLNMINTSLPSPYQDMPDPFSPGLKINRLEQVRQTPNTIVNLDQILSDGGIKTAIENALSGKDIKTEESASIVRALGSGSNDLGVSTPTPKVLLTNALVLYIGLSATVASSTFSASASPARLLERLLNDSDAAVRYQLISAMANQVRYPNSHTHYFSTAMIHLFTVGSEDVQQQIARVLIERLMVARPHPWGLIVTILELVKNTNYNIWEMRWMKAAPEVERMLLSLAHSQGFAQSPR